MSQSTSPLQSIDPFTALYYYKSTILYYGLFPLKDLKDSPHKHLPQFVQTYLYQSTLPLKLWSEPHYRKGTYQQDLKDNLRNVAIPGTGIPLSIFCYFRITAFFFLLFIQPLAVIVATINLKLNKGFTVKEASAHFVKVLLGEEIDWCSKWRANCNVAALHSVRTMKVGGYDMENKWDFLEKGMDMGVPVSPILSLPGICVKHKNEEGGMGIHFYKNAMEGGDWIIQKVISNSDFVQSLLPKNAPLSTFRILTQSRAATKVGPSGWISPPTRSDIEALSCVFRAGLAGALTDHDSILFNIDPSTSVILGGTTNANWYKLGLKEALPGGCDWRSGDEEHVVTEHPDNPGKKVKGVKVKELPKMLELCCSSHLKMCPDVPFVGWDVVLCQDDDIDGGICILEVNLSCNFFRGKYDEEMWWDYITCVISDLDAMKVNKDDEETASKKTTSRKRASSRNKRKSK